MSTAAMEKTLFNMKLTSKQLQRESKKSEKKQKDEEKKVLAAIKKGDREIMNVYASNAIREKNQAINLLRLSSRIDAVAARVETAIRMNTLTKQLGMVTKGMDSVLSTMDVEKISGMMDHFEKQFNSLDVVSGYMEGAISSSTSSAIPEDQVSDLIRMVTEQHKDELKDVLDGVGVGHGAVRVASAAAAAPARVAVEATPIAGAEAPAHPPTTTPGGNGGGGAGGGSGGAGGGGDIADSLAARLAALRR